MPVQTYPDVPKDDVGEMVQEYVDAGAKKVTITPNDDDETLTIVVKT
jgi:hypothetical protein